MSENVSPAQVKDKITKAVQNGESPSTTIAKSSSTPLLNQLMKPAPKKKEGKKPEVSKYTRFATDMESFRDAIGALPSVYKFFWTIYRLNPLRTIIIMAVYITTGLTPALRLRTGGNFIKQVVLVFIYSLWHSLVGSWNWVQDIEHEDNLYACDNPSRDICYWAKPMVFIVWLISRQS